MGRSNSADGSVRLELVGGGEDGLKGGVASRGGGGGVVAKPVGDLMETTQIDLCQPGSKYTYIPCSSIPLKAGPTGGVLCVPPEKRPLRSIFYPILAKSIRNTAPPRPRPRPLPQTLNDSLIDSTLGDRRK